ncbi:MAG: cell division protein FtsA [Candidatus Paceibacterales bacterium]
MAKTKIITGLDIGTAQIKILIAGWEPREGKLELISKIEEGSGGIRRGTVVDVEKVSQKLRDLFLKIAQDSGQKINSVYVNVGGCHLFSTPSHGLVSVSRADQKISEEDIQRVLQAAQAINLTSNKEIFDLLPREFIVDGEKGIKEPLGLQGVRLEAEVLALGGFSPYLKNLSQVVLSSDLEILDMVPSPMATARAVLTERQKELGVGLLDIGAGTTGLAVFEEGDLIHLAIFPIGSANITNDIAIGLKTDIDIAERVKIEYGSCLFKGKNIRQKIDIGEDEPLIFSQKFLIKIIKDRVLEIFEEVNKELKEISKEKLLPAGIVLTGGGSKLPKIVQLAKQKFHLPTRLGKPKGISGLGDDLSLSTASGLVLLGADLEGKEKTVEFGKGIGSKIKKIFKIFIP